MFRRVAPFGTMSAQDVAEQFRSGTAYYGRGEWANGIHATTNPERVAKYGTAEGALRMALRADARTVTIEQLRQFRFKRQDHTNWPRDDVKIFEDLGRLAAALGYDAIEPDSDPRSPWIILNRTAVSVEAAPVKASAVDVPRSRASIARLEERVLTNLERISGTRQATAADLRRAMPDMSAADLDFALEQLRRKGLIGSGDQLAMTGLGRDRLNQPQRFLTRRPRRQFPRRRASEAAGRDVTPGHDELHHYWTRGEGRQRWVHSPKPWTTLVALLTEHVGPMRAKIFASRWFIEVFHYAAGSDKNRVAHGHPPRGQRVGPG